MNKLKIHFFQHVNYEGLGSIEEWVSSYGHSLSSTRFFEDSHLPDLSDFDWLIIMGGAMSVNDEQHFPWLADEKRFIRQAVEAGKTILGICLGSQLISSSLGARVYQNKEKEIGWFDIEFTCFAKSDRLFSETGSLLKVFHWHGDTFDLPENAVHIAYSAGCRNQAYIYKDKVLALQFHLETTQSSLKEMIENGRKELIPSRYIQTEMELIGNNQLIESNKKILFMLLDRLASGHPGA
jgi:GMP synthase-like glutamine amidotransferase